MTQLAHTTRIAISVEDDSGQVERFLAALTALIGLVLLLATAVKPAVVLAGDVLAAADFTIKVLAIITVAVAFGLGVKR